MTGLTNPDPTTKVAAQVRQLLDASLEFELTKCCWKHPIGAGRDHVYIISNQPSLNAQQLETIVGQALADFGGLTREMIRIRSDFSVGRHSTVWGVEFPGITPMPPSYKEGERK